MSKHLYEIREYQDTYASAVATLWNESRDSWGGEQEVETAEDRRQTEASNGNITTLLAYDEDKVVGYCGFSEFRGDVGALYIPLLNVHPHYHGKGIGKQLVLEALKRTIELGWPRLDLYTWPGNTKAVPLYKRCGFFWEERDDTVHLLNFIPKVITHPVLSEYVDSTNWYDTLKREISIKPDGEKENGFTFYTYDFETPKGHVQAKIEQSGRGISAFSTEQYEVEWEMPSHHLLLTGEYEASLRIKNKQAQPLQVKANLAEHEYIEGTLNVSEKVEGEKVFKVPFKVDSAPALEQSKWKAHPQLIIELEIEGIRFPLEVGSNIQKPLALQAHILNPEQVVLNSPSEFYIQVENQLQEEQNVRLTVAGNQEYSLKLEPKENRVLTVPYTSSQFGEQQYKVFVQSSLSWLDAQYEETIQFALPKRNKSFCMDTPTNLYLYHGAMILKCNKENHDMTLLNAFTYERIPLTLVHPMIGLPYSHDLAKQTWDHCSWEEQEDAVVLELTYQLGKRELTVVRVFRWTYDGTLSLSIELRNNSAQSLKDVHVSQLFFLDADKGVLPVQGALLHLEESVEMGLLPLNHLTAPWMYLEGKGHTFSLQWPEDARLFSPSWQTAFEQKAENIQPGGSQHFAPLTIDINVYSNWRAFQKKIEPQPIRERMTIDFSQGHGFCDPKQPVQLEISQLSKQVTVGSLYIQGSPIGQSLSLTGEASQEITQSISSTKVTTVSTDVHLDTHVQPLTIQAIPTEKDDIKKEIDQEQGHKVLSVNNGVISFKAAPSYFPSVYSLQTQKKEWLAHAFPTPGPKSWWNPWGGGLHTMPADLNLYSLLNQSSDAAFVEVFDQWGHTWQGLRVDTSFANHDKWKEMTLRQFFVTLPKSPVLATYYEVDYPDQLLKGHRFKTTIFLDKESEQLQMYARSSSEEHKIAGKTPFELIGEQVSSVVRMWDKKIQEGLVIVDTDFYSDSGLYSNAELCLWTAFQSFTATPEQARVRSKPTFYCVTDQHLAGKGWDWLRNVTFKEAEHENH
ncbi:GNAT family N-acetyltransferase [Alkalicoccobacillus porphyridii]|uniref:GNAT family N-acetyltransferase n=1 Tax=Alkalicoccobacillus porphyridii TaxID=2597270 RepID=A0A553ZUY8_9BACI|nr:GNAT family N-acetyltransferase [Alkalicoccobacillus porphyridii]TSB45233.1 GNAT family N-acetyltransferase [Alkalicoccobacillus porphyridii]